MHRSWTKIQINLYVFHVLDSSRGIVEVIFHPKCTLSIFFMCPLKISNNSFWVISMFILAKNCTEFIVTCQIKMYIRLSFDFQLFSSPFGKIDTFPYSNLLRVPRSPEGVPDLEIFGRVLRTKGFLSATNKRRRLFAFWPRMSEIQAASHFAWQFARERLEKRSHDFDDQARFGQTSAVASRLGAF